MKVQKIVITGFKSFEERTEFVFGDTTVISADNAKGKTTIGEAKAWALTGCDLYGTEKATARLMNSSAKVTEVDVEFEHNGEVHNITRRKKGSSTDVYLDGSKTTNADIYREFLKDKDTFFTIFNPMYFTALSPKDAKDYLLRILPNVSNGEVFAELGDYAKDLLLKDGFRNANTFLDDRRIELSELEKDVIYCEGIIDGQSIGLEIPKEKQFDIAELVGLEHSLTELLSKGPDNTKQTEIEKKLEELRWRQCTVPYERPQLADVKTIKNQYEEIKADYFKTKKELMSLNSKSITCNQCGNEIDINEHERQRLRSRLAELEEKGKVASERGKKAQEENNQLLEDYNKKIKEYEESTVNQIQDLTAEIETVKAEIKQNDQDRQNQIVAIKSNIQELKQVQHEAIIHNQNRTNLIKQMEESAAKVNDAKTKIEKNKARIAHVNMLIDLAKQFNAKKLELESKVINQYLNKVSVQLQKVIKSTGELKEDFKVLYEGREFNVLSHSERIKAGLEISNLTMNLLNIRFPIFIDDAESITKYDKPETQIIEAKVCEGKELTVEVA